MGLGNTVGLTHMALRLAPKILDIIDVVPIVREELAVVDPELVKVGCIQHVVTAPAVRIDDAIGNDLRSMIGIKITDGAWGLVFALTLPPRFNGPIAGFSPPDWSLVDSGGCHGLGTRSSPTGFEDLADS